MGEVGEMGEQTEGGRRDAAGGTGGGPAAPKYDERGLVPAVVQDARTGEVLTLAYVNEESLRRTLETGETWFWSRSRQSLWHKGETSGHTQRVVGLRLDCDEDALLVLVEPAGPACHTGQPTCFHRPVPAAPPEATGATGAEGSPEEAPGFAARDAAGAVGREPAEAGRPGFGRAVEDLYAVVESRRREMPEGSYTTYLFAQGLNKILKKVGEESAETIIAAKDGDTAALTAEISDLIYHLVVLMVERGQSLEAVAGELRRRAAGGGGNE